MLCNTHVEQLTQINVKTRPFRKFYQETNEYKSLKNLIDVALGNQSYIAFFIASNATNVILLVRSF